MQFFSLLSMTALLATSVLAIPTAHPVGEVATLEKRQDVGVYLCVDADFTGYCVHIVQPANTCIELASDLNDKVTAVGPDPDAGDCRFFFDFDCIDNNGFRHFDLSAPGTPNLADTDPSANDQISSYMCFGA